MSLFQSRAHGFNALRLHWNRLSLSLSPSIHSFFHSIKGSLVKRHEFVCTQSQDLFYHPHFSILTVSPHFEVDSFLSLSGPVQCMSVTITIEVILDDLLLYDLAILAHQAPLLKSRQRPCPQTVSNCIRYRCGSFQLKSEGTCLKENRSDPLVD